MSFLLKILGLLSQLQNVQLVRDIEQCVLSNSTPAAMWACILAKLQANPAVSAQDVAMVDAAKAVAKTANL